MSYEFKIIHQVVHGSLSPLYFPNETLGQAQFYKHLLEVPDACTKQIHARFEQSVEQNPTIEAIDIRLLDRYHPPVFVALNHGIQEYDKQLGEELLGKVLGQLALNFESVIEWYHWQDENQQVHLELYANYALDTLSFEEKRYHFYQRLFIEQASIVQQLMLQYIHQVPSQKKAQKYVQHHQQTLLTYASQIMQHLEDTDLQMYTFFGNYSLSDVFKHIFLSLQELSSFIEQQFSQYLNLTSSVPFHHRVQIASNISGQLTTVQKALEQSDIDQTLQGILSVFFAKIKALPHEKASYLQLQRYQQLLQGLEKIVNEDYLSEEKLVHVLLSLNYNSDGFVEWFINRLKIKLEVKETTEEKLEILYYYQKSCKQSLVQRNISFQSENLNFDHRILGWIKEEIAYLEKKPSLTTPDLAPIEEKIKTTLSVAQLALLVRLFREVEIFPEQNQNNIFRRLSAILSSTNQEAISDVSLRGKFYQHDRHTISVLKDKVIAMLNYLNKVS